MNSVIIETCQSCWHYIIFKEANSNIKMNEINLKAYAKINLGLDICGRRSDGYHELYTLMQSVDIADCITIRRLDSKRYEQSKDIKESIHIVSDSLDIPSDAGNIAYKAAAMIINEAQSFYSGFNADDINIEIEIKKNIPVQAGMGGGSADAAAVLAGMNKLLGLDIDEIKLKDYALRLGADVPYCLTGGTALCSGIGEVIEKIPNFPECSFVIVKPGKGMSTKEIFEEFDKTTSKDILRPDINKLRNAVISGDLYAASKQALNVLEAAVIKRLPEIAAIKRALYKAGALSASMTGSGSAVFGIFKDIQTALICAESLKDKRSFNINTEIIPTKSIGKGWEVYRHG